MSQSPNEFVNGLSERRYHKSPRGKIAVSVGRQPDRGETSGCRSEHICVQAVTNVNNVRRGKAFGVKHGYERGRIWLRHAESAAEVAGVNQLRDRFWQGGGIDAHHIRQGGYPKAREAKSVKGSDNSRKLNWYRRCVGIEVDGLDTEPRTDIIQV